MSSRKLFGTDGIRGKANEAPVTPENALRLGRAIGFLLRKTANEQSPARSRFVIGRDTRRSGPMLEAALIAGLNSIGLQECFLLRPWRISSGSTVPMEAW